MADDNEEFEVGEDEEGSIVSGSEAETETTSDKAEEEPPEDEGKAASKEPSSKSLADKEPSAKSLAEKEMSTKSLNKVPSQPGDTLVPDDVPPLDEGEKEEGEKEAEQDLLQVEGEAKESEEGGEGEGAEGEAAAEEPEEEKEPPQHIEPLGEATEETLTLLDYKAWVLEKEYREGKMGRLGLSDVKENKDADSGSLLYDDYLYKHRQLEKHERKVPSYMALGDIRLKPDVLKYEEEKFVLGKMYRNVQDEKGYIPIAKGHASEINLAEAVPVTNVMPKEPLPCFPPPSQDSAMDGGTCAEAAIDATAPCTAKITSPTGKVYEFSFSGMTTLSLQPNPADIEVIDDICGGGVGLADNCGGAMASCPEGENCGKSASLTTLKGTVDAASSARSSALGTCKVNPNCESEIDAVCKAARNAMAIYDTLTGSDNFPCNLGDRDDIDAAEAGVWSWLYQLIYKMVPIERDNNGNQNQATVEAMKAVSKMFEQRPDDL